MAAKTLDRFVLRDVLSDGSAGTVYLADEILPGDNKRLVALKVLPQVDSKDNRSTGSADRFFNEVKVLAQLAVHPHVVTIYAMGLTDNYPWLAMEHAPATLASTLSEHPADPAEVTRLLLQLGRGLSAMHALKPPLIHQDLKPANILIDSLGNYKITDFSLATVVAANRTHSLATVRYAAPELLSAEFGKISPATDLYALGHIAYEIALGSRQHVKQFPAVFEGNSQKEPPPNKWMMWHASINTKPAAVSEVRKEFPAALSVIIARLMAKPLTQRYASADDLLKDLAALQPVPTAAPTETPAPTMPQRNTTPSAPAPAPLAPPAPVPAETQPTPAAAAPSTTAPTQRYWVRLRGRVTGPYDLAAMQRQIRQGAVSRLHQVSTDQVTWKSAPEVEGLFGPTVV